MCVEVGSGTKAVKRVEAWKLFEVERGYRGRISGICHGGPYIRGKVYGARGPGFQAFVTLKDAKKACAAWHEPCAIFKVALYKAKLGQVQQMMEELNGLPGWTARKMKIIRRAR